MMLHKPTNPNLVLQWTIQKDNGKSIKVEHLSQTNLKKFWRLTFPGGERMRTNGKGKNDKSVHYTVKTIAFASHWVHWMWAGSG